MGSEGRDLVKVFTCMVGFHRIYEDNLVDFHSSCTPRISKKLLTTLSKE